jgi:hypothetical protein
MGGIGIGKTRPGVHGPRRCNMSPCATRKEVREGQGSHR